MGGPAGRRPSDVILCTPIGPRVAFDATWAGTRNSPPVQEETGGVLLASRIGCYLIASPCLSYGWGQ